MNRPGWAATWGALLLGAACSGGEAPAGRAGRPHVVLVSLDTTRADHLGSYGNVVVRTPHLDRLAREGIRFADATAAAPTTLASHTSLMTGLHPQRHGVPRNGYVVSPRNHTLAEILEAEGYHTAGFVGSFALSSRFALDQGFAFWDEQFELASGTGAYDQNQRRAAAVTDAVLAYLDAEPPAPLFLFAHYFDPHAPFDPPPPYDRMYARSGAPRAATLAHIERATRGLQVRALGSAPRPGSVARRGLDARLAGAAGTPAPLDEDLAALYAGEISYVDSQLGRLLEGLERRGVLDRAILVVIADHGETFWEHGDFWNHGLWVFDTSVRIPWIVRLPGARHAGAVIAEPVSNVDLLPTLLDWIGIERPPGIEGRSLVSLWRGEGGGESRAVFSEATQPFTAPPERGWHNARKAMAIRRGDYKYVAAPYAGIEQLFRLSDDPAERRDLSTDADPSAAARLGELRAELAAMRASADPLPSELAAARDVAPRLRALGYLEDTDR